MNHGYYSVFNKYTPLVLNHQKFVTDKPLSLQARGIGYVFVKTPRSCGLNTTYICIHCTRENFGKGNFGKLYGKSYWQGKIWQIS